MTFYVKYEIVCAGALPAPNWAKANGVFAVSDTFYQEAAVSTTYLITPNPSAFPACGYTYTYAAQQTSPVSVDLTSYLSQPTDPNQLPGVVVDISGKSLTTSNLWVDVSV
jgi:hypothetical protein